MDSVRHHQTLLLTTVSSPTVVNFDPATLVAYAIRRAAFLTPSDRLALADRLARLPYPDAAAGRFLARRIRDLPS